MVTFDVGIVLSHEKTILIMTNRWKLNWLLIILPNGAGNVNERDEDCLTKFVLRKLQNTMMITC